MLNNGIFLYLIYNINLNIVQVLKFDIKRVFRIKHKSDIVVGLSVPDVIGGVDDEVGSVNVVSLQRGLEELGMVHCAVLLEVKQLVLRYRRVTFVFTPKNLSSSTSTVRSYLSWPSVVRNSASSLSSNLRLSSVRGLTRWLSIQ